MMKRCLWKVISESSSKEGEHFRLQHPEIPFRRCAYLCPGYPGYDFVEQCEHYKLEEDKKL